jgi:hypothetical protein
MQPTSIGRERRNNPYLLAEIARRHGR